MLQFDVETQLSSAQDFTGSATVSTNSYKKPNASQSISHGRRMAAMGIVTTAAGSGSTHTMQVIQADNAALTSNKEVLAEISIAAADLPKGAIFEVPIPAGRDTKQYLGFQNSSSGGTTTVSLDVYLVPLDEIAEYKSFPKTNNSEL